MKRKITDWRMWLSGLAGALVSSSANAVTLIVLEPNKFNLREGGSHLLTAVIVSGIVGASLYLKTAPIPPETEILEPEQNEKTPSNP